MLKCKDCGKPVIRDEQGKLVRECEHVESVVIAECSAKLKGLATVNPR
jgi:hypothetical protein